MQRSKWVALGVLMVVVTTVIWFILQLMVAMTKVGV